MIGERLREIVIALTQPFPPFLKTMIAFQVSKERGEELAIEYGIKFMETSAKASINVEEAFFTLARDIKAKMEKKLVRQIEFYKDINVHRLFTESSLPFSSSIVKS